MERSLLVRDRETAETIKQSGRSPIMYRKLLVPYDDSECSRAAKLGSTAERVIRDAPCPVLVVEKP